MPVRSLRMVLFQHFLLQQWWLRRSASFFLTLHADLALEHLSSKISSPFDNWFSKMKAYRFWQSTFPTGPTENLARTADFVECLLVIARQLGYQWSASTCKTWCLIVLFGTKSQAKRWHKGKAFCLPYNFENDDVPFCNWCWFSLSHTIALEGETWRRCRCTSGKASVITHCDLVGDVFEPLN